MKRLAWTAVAAALLAGSPAAAQDGPALAPLAFLSGCWRGEAGGGGTMEECWTPADADVMLATTRYLRGSRATGWEFSRIHADSTGVFLTPYPDGAASVSFRLLPVADGDEAVFQNAAHDFPKRIRYRRLDARTLRVRIEDDDRGREWTLTAVP